MIKAIFKFLLVSGDIHVFVKFWPFLTLFCPFFQKILNISGYEQKFKNRLDHFFLNDVLSLSWKFQVKIPKNVGLVPIWMEKSYRPAYRWWVICKQSHRADFHNKQTIGGISLLTLVQSRHAAIVLGGWKRSNYAPLSYTIGEICSVRKLTFDWSLPCCTFRNLS